MVKFSASPKGTRAALAQSAAQKKRGLVHPHDPARCQTPLRLRAATIAKATGGEVQFFSL
jgi:hypothetical protein